MSSSALILAARAAIKRSAAVRGRLRGKTPEDRDAQLRATLSDLSAVQAPLTAVLRRGPHTGRLSRNRDVHEASEALQAERAKVRGMLRRASGGRKRGAEPYTRQSFRAYVGYAARTTTKLEGDIAHRLPQLRPGSREYRDDAQRLLNRIDRLQRQLTARRRRADYWSQRSWGRRTRGDRTLFETAEGVAERLTKARRRAKVAVAVPLDVFPKRPQSRKAAPAKRRRWTEEDAWAALVAFTATHGRTPRASDFPNNPDLPSYAKVHALFGGIPEARDLLYDSGLS